MDGGRVSLRLLTAGDGAEYAAELSSGERSFQARATVAADGTVAVAGCDDAPDWLVALTRAVLRAAWRAHATGTPWPRRVTRWRPDSGDTQGPG